MSRSADSLTADVGSTISLGSSGIVTSDDALARSPIQFEYLYRIDLNRKLKSNGSK